ncbi:helix-turn-helix transcriptional regulator [Bacillus sp. BP-3]|uniref:helix-turn-helix transcriptional regulator n=1 Tax=Bacillus sp. BP-3 TaxID=3022773 RepID=UPI00232F82B9|nr:helix-turn-helix transcriptional regulator [Bacillus sp. BP-3]MDC2867551.1 helix-turn-helix transcriptional regulator [Bacillus sp. BP-3]
MSWLNFGKGRRSKLSRFLEKNKITQQELAERSGVSKSTISRVCQGDEFSPTMKNAQKIVGALRKITKRDTIHYDDFWV